MAFNFLQNLYQTAANDSNESGDESDFDQDLLVEDTGSESDASMSSMSSSSTASSSSSSSSNVNNRGGATPTPGPSGDASGVNWSERLQNVNVSALGPMIKC